MAYIEVTSQELRRKAEVLSDLDEQFKNKEGELEGREGALSNMWEGEAKTVFHQEFLKDMTKMDTFYMLIREYVEALLVIAQRYEEAERRNAELASARSY